MATLLLVPFYFLQLSTYCKNSDQIEEKENQEGETKYPHLETTVDGDLLFKLKAI